MFILCLLLLFSSISLTLVAPFLPVVGKEKGLSNTDVGIVIGTSFVTTMVVSPICGNFLHMGGARRWLFVGSIVCAVGLFGFGALHWLEEGRVPFMTAAVLLRVVSASGESMIGPAAYTLATRQMADEHRSKALAIAETAFGSGFMLGPPLGGLLFDLGGFYTPFWTNASCLLMVSLCGLFLLRDQACELAVSQGSVSWWAVVRCPRVLVGFFALLASGTSGQWFSASLEPYLEGEYGFSASQTGLVFMISGISYVVFTPIFGYLADRGLDITALLAFGTGITAAAFFFMAPVPRLAVISGGLAGTLVSIGFQGVGWAAVYLCALVYMLQAVELAGIPDTDRTRGIISSLWVIGDCAGAYVGSSAGGYTYQSYGFSWSILIEFFFLGFTFLALVLLWVWQRCRSAPLSGNSPGDAKQEENPQQQTQLTHIQDCTSIN